MREDFYRMGATLRPLLLMSGHFEETVDRWIRMQEAEVRDLTAKMYVKVSQTNETLLLLVAWSNEFGRKQPSGYATGQSRRSRLGRQSPMRVNRARQRWSSDG